eukprot:scaffold98222_cov86-Phaeocystis_antarctica.AAC.1
MLEALRVARHAHVVNGVALVVGGERTRPQAERLAQQPAARPGGGEPRAGDDDADQVRVLHDEPLPCARRQ